MRPVTPGLRDDLPGAMPSEIVGSDPDQSSPLESQDSGRVERSTSSPDLDGNWFTRPTVTGDWLGLRPNLADYGVTFGGNVTQFYSGVTTGGLERQFRYGGHADYYLNIDGQKAGLEQNVSLALHGETLFGRSVNQSTGAYLPVSLIQEFPLANESVTALTAVKVSQVLSESLVAYAGKLNTLDDFQQPFASGRGVDAFMNEAFLFNPVYSLTVPYSAFGVGFSVLKNAETVVSVTVYDTNNSPTVSGFSTFFDNGVTALGELTIPTRLFGLPGHQTGGFTYSNGKYSETDRTAYLDLIPPDVLHPVPKRGSWAVTYQWDQTLVISAADPARSWGLFGNAGLADGSPNPIRWFASAGLGGSSPIPNRRLDTFGVGYFYLGVSDTLKQLASKSSPLRDEQGLEIFYNFAVTPWFRITPDLEVVVPTLANVDVVLLVGLRAKINF